MAATSPPDGEAIDNTRDLLAEVRALGLPVAYTRVVYADDGSDAGVFTLKAPALTQLTEDAFGSQIVEQLEPREGEYIVRKTQPSAFFGTSLTGWKSGRQGRGHGDRDRMHHLRVRQGLGDRLDELQLQDRSRTSEGLGASATGPSALTMRTCSTWSRNTPT